MFPVEYVYSDWFGWQTRSEAQRADPESLASRSEESIEAGSRVEGFCIPQFFLRKSDIKRDSVIDFRGSVLERWEPDLDIMTASEPFVENNEKNVIPIFTVEHVEDDPKYAKLTLTNE